MVVWWCFFGWPPTPVRVAGACAPPPVIDEWQGESRDGVGREETGGWRDKKMFVGPVVGMKEELKDDECERGKYGGENLDDQDNIFRFEGGNGGILVWTVLFFRYLSLGKIAR
jgi:hypothetical protein